MALDPGMVAYLGYCEASDGKSLVSGEALPAWPDLDERIRVAWRAAADCVLMIRDMRPAGACPATSSTASDFLPCGRPVGHEGWHAGFRPETGQTATWSN